MNNFRSRLNHSGATKLSSRGSKIFWVPGRCRNNKKGRLKPAFPFHIFDFIFVPDDDALFDSVSYVPFDVPLCLPFDCADLPGGPGHPPTVTAVFLRSKRSSTWFLTPTRHLFMPLPRSWCQKIKPKRSSHGSLFSWYPPFLISSLAPSWPNDGG